MQNNNFEQLVLNIEGQLDGVVDTGSDDELFTASYLQGHFAVEASRLLADETATATMLDEKMTLSLQSAFDNNELESADQNLVWALWNRLLSGATADS